MPAEANRVWFRTDSAWDFLPDPGALEAPSIDVSEEARGLRFITSERRIEIFASRHADQFRPFTLYGSGDFHHLSGVWIRQFREPFHLLSFDNHPDWDIRPPRWSCGAWINRALENQFVRGVSIWGCDNFECNLPGRLLANRAAAKAGRLDVHPWKKENKSYPSWLKPLLPALWKSDFEAWVAAHAGEKLYVTLDLDCLSSTLIATNWENGRFTVEDLVWALNTVREKMQLIGGDICGGWSLPAYATRLQKLAGWFDHPSPHVPPLEELLSKNGSTLPPLWTALTGFPASSNEVT